MLFICYKEGRLIIYTSATVEMIGEDYVQKPGYSQIRLEAQRTEAVGEGTFDEPLPQNPAFLVQGTSYWLYV